MQRAVAKMAKAGCAAAFACWEEHVELIVQEKSEQQQLQHVTLRVIMRVKNRVLAGAYDRWQEMLDSRRQERAAEERRTDILWKAAKRLAWRGLSIGFDSWRAATVKHRRMVAVGMKALARWRKQALIAAFRCWWNNASDLRRARRTMGAVLRKWQLGVMSRGWGSWADFLVTQKRARAEEQRQQLIVQRVMMRMIKRGVAVAFGRWSESVSEAKQERAEEQRKLNTQRCCVRKMLHRVLALSFSCWVAELEEILSMRAKGRKAVSRWQAGRLYPCLLTWQHYAAEERQRRRVLTKVVARFTRRAFAVTWLRWVENVQEAVLAQEREKRRLATMRSILIRLSRSALAAAFASWLHMLEAAADERRRRDTASKLVRRWQNLALSEGLNSWVDWKMEVARRRRLMTRILSRITKRVLCVALECWVRWCSEEFAERNQQRAEERNAHIIQSVLHKMLQNRVSAALFAWKGVVFRKRYLKYISAKAVKLSERLFRGVEIKCWGTWMDYVHHRRQVVAGEALLVLHDPVFTLLISHVGASALPGWGG